jgi:hypothetical protein
LKFRLFLELGLLSNIKLLTNYLHETAIINSLERNEVEFTKAATNYPAVGMGACLKCAFTFY